MKMCSLFQKVKTTIITSSNEDFKKIKKTLLLDGYFKKRFGIQKTNRNKFFFPLFLIKILFFLSKNKFDYILQNYL